jgi:SAM-dependent methyltransferase
VSNENFGSLYSKAYELLNSEKNYLSDIQFIFDLCKKYKNDLVVNTVLDLGCGSGTHINLLPIELDKIIGVDVSSDMISRAEIEKKHPKSDFVNAGIAELDLQFEFDLIISLFHVFSYQTTHYAVAKYFETLARHLKPSGLAIFDFWHRPAWELDPPVIRSTKKESENLGVSRTSTPKIDFVNGVVEIEIDLTVKEKSSPAEKYSEIHVMKAFTRTEIEFMARSYNLEIINFGEWGNINEGSLNRNSWYGYVILGK